MRRRRSAFRCRTAPDIFTFRNRGFRGGSAVPRPPGPVVDIGASRLDVSVSATLSAVAAARRRAVWDRWTICAGRSSASPEIRSGQRRRAALIAAAAGTSCSCASTCGRCRAANAWRCRAIMRAAIEPDSTIDLRRIHRHARMPNLGFFASAGYPFTRMADLSGTAAVLPERPNPAELQVFLGLIGQLSAHGRAAGDRPAGGACAMRCRRLRRVTCW